MLSKALLGRAGATGEESVEAAAALGPEGRCKPGAGGRELPVVDGAGGPNG